MKEKIENKLNEIIECIIAKSPEDITYNEYCILDNRLSKIKWDEEQEKKNKEYTELLMKTLSCGFGSSLPAPLPANKE